MYKKIHISTAIRTMIVMAVILFTALPVFALPNPLSGTSSPNGRFIYIPDMSTTGNRIRVIDANLISGEVNVTKEADTNTVSKQTAVVQNLSVPGDPYSMVVNSAGTYLFAVISADPADNPSETMSYVRAYSINATTGLLTEVASVLLNPNSYPRGCALIPSEDTLYVADLGSSSKGKCVRRISIDLANPTPANRLVEQNYISVTGSNMPPFGVEATNSRLYVTINHSTNGRVNVYNITDPWNPTVAATLEGCPQASLVKLSPDGTKLFVRVLDKDTVAGNYYDVKVYNTSDNSLYANIRIPNPGNHQVTGYDPSTGYSAYGNNDEDYRNYDAAFDISADGKTLYFMHYVARSGDGMWHYNIKVRAVNVDDPSISWEANAGVGFHSADSMVFTRRNRLWAFYSDGGYAQATPFLGPDWISHYRVASNEATVIWSTAEYAASYQIQYVKKSYGTVGTVEVSSPTTSIATLEHSLLTAISQPLLSPMTTYEVRIRTVAPNGEYSQWTKNQYVTPESFYTLEPVWVDSYNVNTKEATIVFGPVISESVQDVPYAVRYDLWYRTAEAQPWTQASVPLLSDADPTNEANHTYKIPNLIEGALYIVKMRAVDSTGGVSEWSNEISFEAYDKPWLNNFNTARHSTWLEWGALGGQLNMPGVVSYEVEYKKPADSLWTFWNKYLDTATKEDTSRTALNAYFPGNTTLTEFTTYEARIRGTYTDSGKTSWSNTKTFFTWWALDGVVEVGGPDWVSHYNVDTQEAMVNCEYVTTDSAVFYQFQYREVGGSWQATTPAMFNHTGRTNILDNNPNIKIQNLTPYAEYEVRARAMRNVSGTDYYSDWTPLDSFVAVRGPWWIDVKNVDYTSATLFWEKIPGLTQFEVMYSTNPDATGYYSNTITGTTELVIGTDPSTLAYPLMPNTTYYATVRAITPYGPTAWTGVKEFFTMKGPEWISNYLTDTTSTMLTWEGVSSAASYEITYGIIPAVDTYSLGSTAVSTGPVTTGIVPRTWYNVRVRSHEGPYASTWSALDTFFTIPAPENVQWIGATVNSASVTWEPVDMGGTLCSSYEIMYSETPDIDTGSGNFMTNSGQNYATVGGLQPSHTYYVWVRARDDANSGWSEWAPYPYLTVVATDQATIIDVDGGPSVNGIPDNYLRGTTIKIKGQNLGTDGVIYFNGVPAQYGYWMMNEIAVAVPPNAVAGANTISIASSPEGRTASCGPIYVVDGGFVIDDIEGGTWQYATFDAAGVPPTSVTYDKNYLDMQERNAAFDVAWTVPGSGSFEIMGGISPYGDLGTEEGFDISNCKVVRFWFKGDGTTDTVTFELVESNMAPGNEPANPLGAEVWKYNVPIPLDSGWHEITVKLTTEGTSKFVLDDRWFNFGNHVLDLNKIKAYQILTSRSGNNAYSVDYVVASTVEATKTFNLRAVSNGNINWVTVPFTSTGIANTTNLANAIGNVIPLAQRTAWADTVVIKIWDPTTQSENSYTCMWDGATWSDFGSSVAINVGQMYKVAVPLAAEGRSWTVGGMLPVDGDVSFTMISTATGNENWISTPANLTGLNITTDLVTSVGAKIASPVVWSDVIVVKKWDAGLQQENSYFCMWDGAIWRDFGSNDTISVPDPYVIYIPLSGNGSIWP